MLALLFSVQSIANVQATTYAIPIAQLFYDAVGPRLTIVCLVVVAVAQITASITAFTASSRLFYALARDNAFPAKEKFMALNRYQSPYWGVWTSVLIGCILSCTYIGSAIAVRACRISFDSPTDCFTVQCHVVICGHICDAQLPATHHHPSILARLVSAVFVLKVLKTDDHTRLPEPGPFNLGKWSWPINFVSLLVSPISPPCRVSPNSMTVQHIYLHSFCVTHVIPRQRIQHELCYPGYRWSRCHRRYQLGHLGSPQFCWANADVFLRETRCVTSSLRMRIYPDQ